MKDHPPDEFWENYKQLSSLLYQQAIFDCNKDKIITGHYAGFAKRDQPEVDERGETFPLRRQLIDQEGPAVGAQGLVVDVQIRSSTISELLNHQNIMNAQSRVRH